MKFPWIIFTLISEPDPCDISADLAFIFPSGDIGQDNFLRQNTAIKTVAKSFGISPRRSRASMVTFSDSRASLVATLDAFSSTNEFEESLSSLRYGGGLGDLSVALKLAEEKIFPKARERVARIAVVILDDKVNRNGLWRDSVLSLRKAGVRVLLVGVGSKIDRASLRKLVHSDADVLIVDSFIGLLKNSVGLSKSTCDAASK